MSLEETLIIDGLMLVSAGILIFLTYQATRRLARSERPISLNMILALRIVTWGEIMILTYSLVDIPWSFILIQFPEASTVVILKYVIVYAIIITIIVLPIITTVLRVPVAEPERRRRMLLLKRENLLREMHIITTKYLKKEINESVFKDVGQDIHKKLAETEAKLERLRMETERQEMMRFR